MFLYVQFRTVNLLKPLEPFKKCEKHQQWSAIFSQPPASALIIQLLLYPYNSNLLFPATNLTTSFSFL